MLGKRDAINFISKFISFFINIIITFFVTSYVIEHVGSEAYGFVGLANEFVGYAQIVAIALNSMASRFIAIEVEKKNNLVVNQFGSSLFIMNVIIAACVSFIGSAFIIHMEWFINITAKNSWDVKILWFFVLFNFMISLLGTVFQVATFCRKRLELEALRNVIASIIKAIILIICYSCFPAYIWYVGLATLASTLYLFVYNLKYTKMLMPEMKIRPAYFQKEKVFTLVRSGGWNSLTQIGVTLSSGLDLLVTNIFVSGSAMGILSVAKTIPRYIYSLVSTLSGTFTPNFVLLMADNDTDGMARQLKSSIRIMSFFTIIPLVMIVSLGKNIYCLWVPAIDEEVLFWVSSVAAVGYLAVMPFEVIWSVYTALNKVKVSSIYLVAEALCNVALELLLIQFTDSDLLKMIIIVGVTSFLMFVRAFVFLPRYTSKQVNIGCRFLYSALLKNIVVFVILSITGTIIMNVIGEYSWKSLILGGGCIVAVSSLFCFFTLLSAKEKEYISAKLLAKVRRN